MQDYQKLMKELRKSLREANAAFNNLSYDDLKELTTILFTEKEVPDQLMDSFKVLREITEVANNLIELEQGEFLPKHFRVSCNLLNGSFYGDLRKEISLQKFVWSTFFKSSRLAGDTAIKSVEDLIKEHTAIMSKHLYVYPAALEEIQERFREEGYIYITSEIDVMDFISIVTYAAFSYRIGEVFNESVWEGQYKFLSLEDDNQDYDFSLDKELGRVIYFIKQLNFAVTGEDFSESNHYVESKSNLAKPYLFERDFVLDTGLESIQKLIDLYINLLKGTYTLFDFYGNVGLRYASNLYTLKETTLEGLMKEVRNSELFIARQPKTDTDTFNENDVDTEVSDKEVSGEGEVAQSDEEDTEEIIDDSEDKTYETEYKDKEETQPDEYDLFQM